MKIRREIWIGYEFFGEKIIFPSAPVSGINNDQSLKSSISFAAAISLSKDICSLF